MCVVKTETYFCFQYDSFHRFTVEVTLQIHLSVLPTLRGKLLLFWALGLFKAVRCSLPSSHLSRTLWRSFWLGDCCPWKTQMEVKAKACIFFLVSESLPCLPRLRQPQALMFFSFCFKFCFLREREARGMCVQRRFQAPAPSGLLTALLQLPRSH